MAPDSLSPINDAERALIRREGKRIVDEIMGRADPRTVVAHYLITDALNASVVGPKVLRSIEQYRDLERVVATAADCETGHMRGTWVGAFTATYVDGRLASIDMVEDLPAQIAAEIEKRPEDRLQGLRGAPMLQVIDDSVLADGLAAAAEAGLRAEANPPMPSGRA